MKESDRTVLEIGMEGGSFRIESDDTGEKFRAGVQDSMWAMIGESAPKEDRLFPYSSFEAALESLDRYPWHKGVLMELDPEYEEPLLQKFRKRKEESRGRVKSEEEFLDGWRGD